MLHWFARRLADAQKEQKGFTLIELLVVVVIIGILAAIAIPVFLNQRTAAEQAKVQSDVRNSVSVSEQKYALENSYFAAGNYTTAAPMQDAGGNNMLVPSTNVTLAYTNAGNSYTTTGTNPNAGATYSYAYDSATGVYTETP